MIKINACSRVLTQKEKPHFFYGFPIDHLPIPDLIKKLCTFSILLFDLFPFQRTNWFPFNARATENIKNLRCNTTKHGYQSKKIYGKVVHKQKMDSYIVGKKINPIRYCKILNVSRHLHILG